jgi:hypothetical protein
MTDNEQGRVGKVPATTDDMRTGRDTAQYTCIGALAEIAHGRRDCGRPLEGEAARQLARRALLAEGETW